MAHHKSAKKTHQNQLQATTPQQAIPVTSTHRGEKFSPCCYQQKHRSGENSSCVSHNAVPTGTGMAQENYAQEHRRPQNQAPIPAAEEGCPAITLTQDQPTKANPVSSLYEETFIVCGEGSSSRPRVNFCEHHQLVCNTSNIFITLVCSL